MKRDELDLLIKNGYLQSEPDNQLWQQELDALVNQGFLEQLPNHYFSFNNNLTWEVVYETLLYAERRRLHNIVAKHIEQHNEGNLNTVADMLLYHYEKANDAKKSIYYACIAADRAVEMYSNSDAISYYQRAHTYINSLQRRSNTTDLTLIHERIGDAYDAIGEYAQAINSFQASLNIWRTRTTKRKSNLIPASWIFNSSRHEANICRKLAMAYEHSADYEESLRWLSEAETHLPTRPGIVACQIHATRSATQFRMGKYKEAIDSGNTALKIAKRVNSSLDICYVNNMLANSYMRLGNLQYAKKLLVNSIKIYESLDNYAGVAASNYSLGECCAYTSDLDEAISYLTKALEVDLQLKNIASIAMDYYILGSIQLIKGDLDDGITSLSHIVELDKNGKIMPDLAALAHIYLCSARRVQNKLDQAEENIRYCLKLLERIGENQYISDAQLEFSELLLAQQKFEEAKSLTLDVLKKASDDANPIISTKAYRILANIVNELGDYTSALKFIDESISISKEVGLENDEAFSIISKTKFLIKAKNISEVRREDIIHAIEILSRAGAKLDLQEAESLLQQVEKSLLKK